MVHPQSHARTSSVKYPTLDLEALKGVSLHDRRRLLAEALLDRGTFTSIVNGNARSASVARLTEAAQRLGLVHLFVDQGAP